jgi:mRNA-degrading endonuclease RelE of RelBE toxin-antitoxin system
MAFTPLLSRLRSGDFRVYYRVLSEEVVLLPLLIREIAKGF